MKVFLLFLLIFCFTINGNSQDESIILTNLEVLEMVKANLPDSVIITKIQNSRINFDTSIDGLKVLNGSGVSEDVISAMITGQKISKERVSDKTSEVVYSNENPEFGEITELKGKTKVFIAINDLDLRKMVTEKITKYKGLEVVTSRDQADFGINYLQRVVEQGSNALLGTVSNKAIVGEMIVYFYLPKIDRNELGRIRIIWSKKKVQDWSGGLTFDKHPAKSAIGSFLKEYKKINK